MHVRVIPLYELAVCAALAFVGLASFGKTQAQNAVPATFMLAKNEKAPRQHRPELGPIACGKGGCHHIPLGCHPEMTFDIMDNPTGYETAVCPDERGR
jgi:hypothetical protein